MAFALFSNVQAAELPLAHQGEVNSKDYIEKPLIVETQITKEIKHTPTQENRFAYGNCTYYVASKVEIPWKGNAGTWLSRAEDSGYNIGNDPVPDAVLVTNEGPIGHVSLVEDVDYSARTFTISEMNYIGFNRVDRRTLPFNYSAIKGFIYTEES